MSCDPKNNHDHDHFFFSRLKILSKFSLFLIPKEVSPHLPTCLNKSIVCTNKVNSEQERRAWWAPQVWLAVLMPTITPASSSAFPPLPRVVLWRRQLRLTDALHLRKVKSSGSCFARCPQGMMGCRQTHQARPQEPGMKEVVTS